MTGPRPGGTHLDLHVVDVEGAARWALGAGATEWWTVMADPAGLPHCITARDPRTGTLGAR